MNILLLSKNELTNDNRAILTGRRQNHIRTVLRLGSGDKLKAGIINDSIGTATIIRLGNEHEIEVQFDGSSRIAPPPAIPCKVILAMPRPKMMRRVIQNLSSMGIKEIHLINSWRVEKSFWQTPWLEAETLEEQLILGLEQSVDTVLPSVRIHKLFKPFVEDCLPEIITNHRTLLAHPYTEKACPVDLSEPSNLIIGPEGGFTEYEVDLLQHAGVETVSIGPRILRVETAVPALISRLYPAP